MIGQVLRIDRAPATIAGILPAWFYKDTADWQPLQVTGRMKGMRGTAASVYARLQPGVSREQAQERLSGGLAVTDPVQGEPSGVRLTFSLRVHDIRLPAHGAGPSRSGHVRGALGSRPPTRRADRSGRGAAGGVRLGGARLGALRRFGAGGLYVGTGCADGAHRQPPLRRHSHQPDRVRRRRRPARRRRARCVVPARRAMPIDPMVPPRAE